MTRRTIMIKLIKKLFGIATPPVVVDSKPERKYAGNSHDRKKARRKAERDAKQVQDTMQNDEKLVFEDQHTSVDEANEIIQFLQNEIDEAKVEQREFCDYPTLIDRRQS
tara:strand:- start:18 stop:344 length:327 start_codon:yes stop_codon:yes gene_type:complete